ncbi:MAG: hypothetical protein HC866_06445 [Leptolyngbyaceae cyanobacterium RU_5_1]|nr:hypothetical protein [Leptolyngbyaceae cyanobacterium RU_5_1]
MMIGESIQDLQSNEQPYRFARPGQNIRQAQEIVYSFLLEIVKKWPPEEVLLEFKRLFIYHVDSISSSAVQAVYEIIISNNHEEFKNTLKRSCYILVNNWDASRNYKPIRELIEVFSDPPSSRHTHSPSLKKLRTWINAFVNSKDFEELKLFTSRYEEQIRGPWTSRYTSYLLVPQYIDLRNPIEQREAARAFSRQLKERFKFDLAMYIARSQTSAAENQPPKNPTVLGDDALRLVKMIVAKRGQFNYVSLANIFLNQVQNTTYREFKQSLQSYLSFSIGNKRFADILRTKLGERLKDLYISHDYEIVTSALVLRTCNRIIDFLTCEENEQPSSLFILLLSQGSPIALVVTLLKIILVCKYARTHLEARIAELIKNYQNEPEDECSWVVNFLEIFNLTFAIYAENVQYNLIRMDPDQPQEPQVFDPDTYRIFSQLKYEERLELFPELLTPEELLLDEESQEGIR